MKKITKSLVLALGLTACSGAGYGRVLVNDKVGLLKGILKVKTPVVARIITALTNANIVLNGLAQYEAMLAKRDFTEAQIALYDEKMVDKLGGVIVEPIVPFFMDLYEFRSYLSPIVEESLGYAEVDPQESILYKFLDTKDESVIPTFFEDNVKTKHVLKSSCEEFVVLFGDLEETLPAIFKAGEEFLAKEKEEQEAAEKEAAEKEAAEKEAAEAAAAE